MPFSVSPWREEDVEDLPELVDGLEQAAPGPADLQVRFIDVSAIVQVGFDSDLAREHGAGSDGDTT